MSYNQRPPYQGRTAPPMSQQRSRPTRQESGYTSGNRPTPPRSRSQAPQRVVPGSSGARDRLGELRAAGVPRPATIYNDVDASGPTQFLDSVASLDKSLRHIKSDLSRISQMHRKAFDNLPEHQVLANKEELEQTSEDTKLQLQRAKQTMNTMDDELQYMQPGTADFVMCSNQLNNLKKNYQSYVQEFHQLETQFAASQRSKMLREMRVVKADATEDDLDEYMASGGQGGIFAQQVLHSSRYGAARNALRQVEDRQAELVKIEQMVVELANLFLDLNTLIEQQDYTINQVAEFVEEAAVQIETGEKEVEQAIEIRKDSIKWSWYLCICIIVLIIAILIYLFVFGPLQSVLFGSIGGGGSTSSTPTPTPTPVPAQRGSQAVPPR